MQSPHSIFFMGACAFLLGVACTSFGVPMLYALVPAGALCTKLIAQRAGLFASLFIALLFLLGCWYFAQDNARHQTQLLAVPQSGKLEGMVTSAPKETFAGGTFYLTTPLGVMLVETDGTTFYHYGDTLLAQGKITPPAVSYWSTHTVGIFKDPRISVLSSGGGNPLLRTLFALKDRVRATYQALLSPQESALLFGIMAGGTENFSRGLTQELSLSGARYLTAIDGLHMQIIIVMVFGACVSLLPRRWAIILSFLVVGLFIALTGFTDSAIRSALMAALAMLAKETKRSYALHTALALAALVLVTLNPMVLVFDAGFQLSFCAVCAIVYLLPVLQQLFRMGEDPGFLGWKQSLLAAFSVQLATAPIVIMQFGTFSFISFLGSMLVLPALPVVLVLGFLTALFSFLFAPATVVLALTMAPLLQYLLFIIELFARIALPFNPTLSLIGALVYYAVLLSFVFWWHKARRV